MYTYNVYIYIYAIDALDLPMQYIYTVYICTYICMNVCGIYIYIKIACGRWIVSAYLAQEETRLTPPHAC